MISTGEKNIVNNGKADEDTRTKLKVAHLRSSNTACTYCSITSVTYQPLLVGVSIPGFFLLFTMARMEVTRV